MSPNRCSQHPTMACHSPDAACSLSATVTTNHSLFRKTSRSKAYGGCRSWMCRALGEQRPFKPGRATATLERAQRAFDALGRTARFLLVYYSTDGAGGWQPLDRPLRTITTVDRFALVESWLGVSTMRMLQVPELKRAMGFHDAFALPCGTRRERIHLLGTGSARR